MKTHTVSCPHCGHLRHAKLNADGELYEFEVDGQCGECNKWHDDDIIEGDNS